MHPDPEYVIVFVVIYPSLRQENPIKIRDLFSQEDMAVLFMLVRSVMVIHI